MVSEPGRLAGTWWRLRPADTDRVQAIRDSVGCPEAIARLLVARGLQTTEDAAQFFLPNAAQMHDPRLMLGMDRAVERIRAAVRAGEPMLIYGDYDVDGTTATVLLKTAIERLGTADQPAKVTYHVPHRLREGYGMQVGRLQTAAETGVRLVLSVDTGIRAFRAAEEAKRLGLDLIVTDHHLPDEAGVPDALAVLNPNQVGCPYPYKGLCGAAVAFKLAHALLLAGAGNEAERADVEQRLVPSFLKLVALATVADAVPLTGENRALAALGLRELARPVQPGLRALLEVAGLPGDRAPTATEVGFRLGPRINAAGRMDVASDVVELFLTRDRARARTLAEKLDQLNEERRATEREALGRIDEELEEQRLADGEWPAECLVLHDAGWHRGVLGILASRVVDRTGRPALVMSHADGEAHGSGRSIAGFHLLDALTAVHEQGCAEVLQRSLFSRFGGHAHAVGFALPSQHIGLLRERMRKYGQRVLRGEVIHPPLEVDAEIQPEEVGEAMWGWVERCAPFGNGNTEPMFLTRGLRLLSGPRLLKAKHVLLELELPGVLRPLRALGWSRTVHWPTVCRRMGLVAGSAVDVVYRMRWNDGSYAGKGDGCVEVELVALTTSVGATEGRSN